ALSESLVEVEVELARLRERADEKSRELAELRRRHLTPRSVSEDKAREADVETLAADIARLERRLESIGPVNPLAEQEYRATEERARFLAEQRKDLEASMAELQRLVGDLEEHIQTTFAEVFEATRANFSEMVGVLFPGGKGVLRLAEDHPEDAEPAGGGEGRSSLPGIALEIKPPKKAPRSISLLSGGEKALAAIAFLFALFLARPCPFYLLDEVEAALDDLNLGRFLSLVRRYQGKTQFIIITHQRRTMEIAHTLYGVALDPDGTSRVLSRRLASAGGVSAEGAGDAQAGSAAGSG
ncbi:MAG: AAA family ATPase, partial [Actinobacteria bacterium]|nr:AAA family ATPase [Actinomycetota bacterium]